MGTGHNFTEYIVHESGFMHPRTEGLRFCYRLDWYPYKIQLHKQRNFIGGSNQSPRSKKIDRYSNWFKKIISS